MINDNTFRKIFEANPCAGLLVFPNQPQYTIAAITNSFLLSSGFSKEELVGTDLSNLFNSQIINSANLLAQVIDECNKTKATQNLYAQLNLIPLKGMLQLQEKYYDLSIISIDDNHEHTVGIAIYFNDVTEKIFIENKNIGYHDSIITQQERKNNNEELLLATWELDVSKNQIICGDDLYTIYGLDKNTQKISVELIENLVHPEDRERRLEAINKAIETASNLFLKYRIIRPNGKIVSLVIIATPKKDNWGKVIRMDVLTKTIAPLEKVEAKLFETLHKLQLHNKFVETILNNLPIGIAVHLISTSEASIINDQFFEIYGWDAGDFNDVTSFFKSVYPDKVYRNEISTRILGDIQSGDVSRMHWEGIKITTKSGEERIINAKNIPLYNQDLMISTVLDVTKHFQLTEELRIANDRFNYVSKATADAVFEWNIHTNEVYWSESTRKPFGYIDEHRITNRVQWLALIHPDDLRNVDAFVHHNIMNKALTNWETEYRLKRFDGSYANAKAYAYAIRDAEGNILKTVGVVRDLSRRKAEEGRLRLLESVITNTTDVVLITEGEIKDDDGLKIIFVNEAFTALTGYTQEEVMGKTSRILQGPNSDWNEKKRLKESLKRKEPCEITTINYKKNREEYWVNIQINPVFNKEGILTNWVAIERNVTKQKEEEKRLKLLETVMNNMGESVVMTEADPIDLPGPRIIYANPAFYKLTGYTPQEVLGNTPRVLQGPLSNRKSLNELKQALMLGLPHKLSTVNYKKNHEPIWINASINPVFNEKGSLVNWVGVQRNVTEEKKAELKMATLHEDLIKQANKLEESNKELEHFAYIASHDLQEPLRMVASFLGLLEKKYDGVLDEKGKQYLNFAIDGAKRMRQMVMDLLEYSRVGRIEASVEKIDLNTLVRDIVKYHNEKQDKDKRPIINVGNLPVVMGLRTPFMQVFQNLISNGIKYKQKDVASIVNINVTDEDDYWHFTVQDNGMGIKEEYYDKIFIIFQRLHTTEKIKGTGLGLAITKKIIESLGGKIWVESVVGEGSTFNFTISKKHTNGTIKHTISGG